MNKPYKCELCDIEEAVIECDDGLWRCADCTILAGYGYLIKDKIAFDVDDLDEEDW